MRGSLNIYNLPEHLQARAMCSIIADTDRHRFAIGSSSVANNSKSPSSGGNEIHMVSYSEDANRIDTDLAFPLQGVSGRLLQGYEVSQLSSSPYNRGTLVAAVTPTSLLGSSEGNKVIFYQVQERAAGTILDEPEPQIEADNDAAAGMEEDAKRDSNEADPQDSTVI